MRYLAEVNPPTPEFDRLAPHAELTFMPLEAVWADGRHDASRVKVKSEVMTGYTRFRDGDILLPKVAPTFQAGRVARVHGLIRGVGAGTTELHVLRARPGVDPRYVAYALRSKHFIEEGVTAFQGVAGLQRVPDRFVSDFKVAELPLDEQVRIANFLDAETARLDRLIDLRQRQMAAVEERSSAWVDRLVREGVGHTEFDEARFKPLARVPRVWRQARLRNVPCEVQTGPFGSQLHAEEYVVGGWPVINPANIQGIGLVADPNMTVDDFTRARLIRHILRAGDVVFGRRGELGRAGLVGPREEGWLCGTGSLRVRFCGQDFVPGYLAHYLRIAALRHYFLSQSVGSTMDNLNTQILLRMPILIPPLREQVDIAAACDWALDRGRLTGDALRRSIDLLRDRRAALIAAAVTGHLDVTTARGVA